MYGADFFGVFVVLEGGCKRGLGNKSAITHEKQLLERIGNLRSKH